MSDNEFLSFPDAHRGELDQAISDLVEKAQGVLTSQGRLRALLRANQVIVEQLDLSIVLERIVTAAVDLVGAKYGALGVVSPHGGLEQFINVGMTAHQIDIIGQMPEGHGLLGALIDDPRPIRLETIADDPRSSGFPAGHPPMGSFLGVPIRVRTEVFGNLYLANSSAGVFSAEDEQLVTALAATAGVAIENARLFAETKRRQAWSAASAEITAALLASDTSAETDLVSLIASRVLPLAEADLVCVLLDGPGEHSLTIDIAIGEASELVTGRVITTSASSLGGVLEAGHPRLFAAGEINEVISEGMPVLGPAMAIPLIVDGTVNGLLLVARAPKKLPFVSSDVEMAADFAGQTSLAMELARARADRQRMVLLEDRARIARDLHDHVIQQIFSAGLELQSIAGGSTSPREASRIIDSVATLDASISQIRTIIFALSPRTPANLTMRHRMLDLVNELAAGFDITPQLSFSGPVDLIVVDDLADDVTAVSREGLTNIAKHASAAHSSVRLDIIGASVVLEISDDGTGMPVKGRRSGLANIRHRAEARGGTFDVDSTPAGTMLRWCVPFDDLELGS